VRFADEVLNDFQREINALRPKYQELQRRYLLYEFTRARAKEHAHNGFVRRLSLLVRCAENVFALIPPGAHERPADEVRTNAEINIQASIFNVFAAADNLAWIWVTETGVKQPNGLDLTQFQIGIRRNNRIVRESLTEELRVVVEGFDDWFDMVDNYRHSLAHRIPLYIPPFCVDPANEAEYQQLEDRKWAAVAEGNVPEQNRLRDKQTKLEFFHPVVMHSFGECARPLLFHPQLLANFNTIEELGRTVLDSVAKQRRA